MYALVLNLILSVAFFHVIRVAQVRGRNMMVVGATNYILASVSCFCISAVQGNLVLSGTTVFWGTVQGIAFIGTFYLMCASMALSGLAIATAFMRLSVVIPVLASIFYWGETPNLLQVLGILACLVSLPLIGMRARHATRDETIGWREIRTVLLLILGVGMSSVASKGFVESQVPDARTTFMGVLYGVAALGALGTFVSPVWRRQRTGMWDGVKMGFFNVTSIVAFLVALEQVSGVVAFPVQAAGGLLVNTLFAATVWHERFVRRTQVGMAVAAVGLVLVNLK
ncbi:MAG: hypothetical protein O2954_02085 [bacterium]|nr:hypothetical protein [bacterium]